MSVSHSPASLTVSLHHIESFLETVLSDLEVDDAASLGRPRILPALALWSGVLVCVLRGMTSQLAIWRLLTQIGLWSYPRYPVTDQAVYDRLAAGGTAPLETLFTQVRDVLRTRQIPEDGLAPFATGVYALDQTMLDPVARTLPALQDFAPGDAHLLPGRLDAVFNVRQQVWDRVRYEPDARKNELPAAADMVDGLPRHALIVADLGYYGFERFDALTDAGYFWLSRLKPHASYTPIHTFYAEGETLDALVWLGAYRADRAKHAVRLVQYRTGNTLYRYITNVRDPRLFPLHEVARVYARRWDIEKHQHDCPHRLPGRISGACKPLLSVLSLARLSWRGQRPTRPLAMSLLWQQSLMPLA